MEMKVHPLRSFCLLGVPRMKTALLIIWLMIGSFCLHDKSCAVAPTLPRTIIQRNTPFNPGFLGVALDAESVVCIVRIVMPNSPAEIAGILPGDIITHCNGQQMNMREFVESIRHFSAGRKLKLTVKRDNVFIMVPVTLIERMPKLE